MIMEKAVAWQQSAMAMMTGHGKKSALAPWHKRAMANARRLRRKSEGAAAAVAGLTGCGNRGLNCPQVSEQIVAGHPAATQV